MELCIVVVLLFYGAIIEAKEFLKTGRIGDAIRIPENSPEETSEVLAFLILEHSGSESEESGQHLPFLKPKTMSLNSSLQPKPIPTDSSGDSNSDEYPDSDGNTGTDSESNYYHEDDYKNHIIDKMGLSCLLNDNTKFLRKRWRSCQKKAAKVCREACVASYKNACDMSKCKKKLKKNMKQECKRNCKEFFT